MSNRTNRRGDHGLPLPPPAGTKTSKSFKAIDLLADDRWNKFTIPALTILLTITVASLILLLIGRNPVIAFRSFLQGSGLWPKNVYTANKGILTDLFSFLGIFSPMLLASLGVVVAMKAGMFNIGISGQMLLSGFIATVFVGYSNLPGWAAKPLVLIIGIAAGGLLGALVGYLKYRFNIHEVVSTIMFNYIISYVTGFFINGFYADTITRTSRAIKPASRLLISDLTLLGQKINFPIGLPIALITVFIILFFINRTVSGFEIKMIGYNRVCAQYAGVRVGSGLVRAMAISGILAGLAGVTYYLGYYNTIVPKELASMGYDSIAVSLLGNSSPVGCIFASFLITIFQKGSVYMSSSTGVAKEIASVITGILLLFSATGIYIRTMRNAVGRPAGRPYDHGRPPPVFRNSRKEP